VAGLGSTLTSSPSKTNLFLVMKTPRTTKESRRLRGYRKGAATLIVREHVAPVEIVMPV
jgi:hypothetical protein